VVLLRVASNCFGIADSYDLCNFPINNFTRLEQSVAGDIKREAGVMPTQLKAKDLVPSR
jgi:hypothetical protein